MSKQQIGIFIIILDTKKKSVLLGKRLNSYKAGSYGLPGGRIEVGEPLKEAAKRELLEETGLIGKKFNYIGVVREFQETYDFIHFAFVCEEYSGQPKVTEPEKCEKWEFIQLANLPENILPAHHAGIDLYKDFPRTSLVDIT